MNILCHYKNFKYDFVVTAVEIILFCVKSDPKAVFGEFTKIISTRSVLIVF